MAVRSIGVCKRERERKASMRGDCVGAKERQFGNGMNQNRFLRKLFPYFLVEMYFFECLFWKKAFLNFFGYVVQKFIILI